MVAFARIFAGKMLVVGSLACLACGPSGPPPGPEAPKPSPARAAVPPSEDFPSLKRHAERQGLSEEEQRAFFHLAEGSELFPLSWLRALETPQGKPFLQNTERFGLLSDPDNQDKLPVGITAEKATDLNWTGMRMVGVNCAACHVGEFAYQGKTVRVIGAPNQFDVELFFSELVGAVQDTASDGEKAYRFLGRLLLNGVERVLPTQPDNEKLYAKTITKKFPELRDLERGDLFQKEMAVQVRAQVLEQKTLRPALNLARDLQVQGIGLPAPNAVQIQRTLVNKLNVKPVQLSAPLLRAIPGRPGTDFFVGTQGRQQVTMQTKGFLGELLTIVQLLQARAEFLKNLAEGSGSQYKTTKPLFGRVDAFNSARNITFPEDRDTANTPVSYPHLWGLAKLKRVHWDGNTNSLMERNMGQAIGLGAVLHSGTGKSTLLPRNIHRLETVARKIEAPPWPVAVFGAIDAAKAANGQALFMSHCNGCHSNEEGEPSSPGLVKTEGDRADTFAREMKDKRKFVDALAAKLKLVKQKAYQTHGVSAEEAKEFEAEHDPPEWEAPGNYVQRPLTAIWATAPYLHNGSVSSIFELLSKSEHRKPFFVGVREYDPQKLGYVTTAPGPSATQFDPTVPGNRNMGHEYGAELSDIERYELIEYLKTL